MAKEQVFTAFSGSPDDFGVGFLDDFDGTYTDLRYIAHPYKSAANFKPGDKYGLFVKVSIRPDDTDEDVVYYLRAGFLGTFVPSQDGKSPAGGLTLDEYKELAKGGPVIEEGTENEYSGPYAISPGNSPKTFPPSDWHQHFHNLRELGYNKIDPRVDSLVGTRCHFNRLSIDDRVVDRNGKKVQINQKMQVKEGDNANTTEWKIICPTAILEPLKGSKSTASSSKSTTSSNKPDTNTSDTGGDTSNDTGEDPVAMMDMLLEMDISGVLTDAGEPLPRNKVVEAMKPKFMEYDTQLARNNALQKMSNVKWMNHEDRPWSFEGGKYQVK